MKTKMYSMMCAGLVFLCQQSKSQNVGINIDTPQAVLHVHGTFRADSLGVADTFARWQVVCDSAGNFFKKPVSVFPEYSDETVQEFEYGRDITAGDLVSVGDGRSGYMRCNGDGAFVQNESTSPTRFIAQGFSTIAGLVGIRAVNIKVPITSGQNTVIFSVCPAINGLPNMSQAVSRTETFTGGSSTGWSLFIFDPPLYAPENAPCFLVVRAYGGTSTTKNLRTVSESITGNLVISNDAGVTWSTIANRDLEVQIYEARHGAGKAYPAQSVWKVETLRPDQATVLATSGTVIYRDLYDVAHNVIGVALESGTKGSTRKISLGPVVTVNQTLVPGMRYFLTDNPGVLGLGMPASFFNVPVGFALDSHRLYLTR